MVVQAIEKVVIQYMFRVRDFFGDTWAKVFVGVDDYKAVVMLERA